MNWESRGQGSWRPRWLEFVKQISEKMEDERDGGRERQPHEEGDPHVFGLVLIIKAEERITQKPREKHWNSSYSHQLEWKSYNTQVIW